MANHVLQKLGSMFTAAILCASCLPFGSVSAAGNNTADADISETIPNLVKSPEQLVQDAERGDFLTLSYATLLDCAYFGAGYASTFSEKNQTLLDVDHSGRIDSTDIFLLMYWCAYQGATGDYTEDSITFLSRITENTGTTVYRILQWHGKGKRQLGKPFIGGFRKPVRCSKTGTGSSDDKHQ